MKKRAQPYTFEIYPIQHRTFGVWDKQLWQWRLKYGRKVLCAGVEMGDGGRHGYASKRGAFEGLRSTARAFGMASMEMVNFTGVSLRPGRREVAHGVELVVKSKAAA